MSVGAVATRRRSELEAAAEAVMQVVDSGLLPKTPALIANVASVTGIAVPELRAAWRRIQDSGYDSPRQRPALALVQTAEPLGCDNCQAGRHDACHRRGCDCLADLESRVQAHGVHTVRRGREPEPLPQNRERHARVRPTPTTKVCPRCKEEKPIASFYIKDKATGATQSFCKDCNREYSRERYLRVGARAIAVELLDGDGCVGEDCPRCGKPFEVGQRVKGSKLTHEVCV